MNFVIRTHDWLSQLRQMNKGRTRATRSRSSGIRTQSSDRRSVIETLEPRIVLDGNIVISEFMAVQTYSQQDEDGDFSDWIEIYNGDVLPQNLAGWSLSNDSGVPGKWTFPAGVSIGSGQFLRLFASGKNRRVAGEELHTNFELADSGGYLALLDSTSTVVHEFSDYGPQFSDVSYGIDTPALPTSTAITIVPTLETWIRELDPDRSFENDAMWIATPESTGDGQARWGIAEWDLSGLDPIVAAHMEFNPRTRADPEALQVASTIDSGIDGLTWNTYFDDKFFTEDPLESLGSIEIPTEGVTLGEYISGDGASANDLLRLNDLRVTSETLTVIFTTEFGAIEWNDGANDGGGGFAGDLPIRLVVQNDFDVVPPELDLTDTKYFTLSTPGESNNEGMKNLIEGVFITEFLAINDKGREDIDGNQPDWIEIYNATTEPVDLTGWQLSTDSTHVAMWSFPDGQILGEGQFLTVFASGKNRRVTGEELHTDFTLKGDGGYLALLDNAAGLRSEYDAYPQQFSDVAYGIQFGLVPENSLESGVTEIPSVADVWVREVGPDTTFENDWVSVWSSATNDGGEAGRRYGLIEWDVSSLAGLDLSDVTMSLWSADSFSGTTVPVKMTAFVIDTSIGTPLLDLTWNSLQDDYLLFEEEIELESLGRFDVDAPNNDPDNLLGVYVDDLGASAADIALVEAAANSDSGLLSVLFIADEDGVDYRGDWGDGTNDGGSGFGEIAPGILKITLDGFVPESHRIPLDPNAIYFFETPTPDAPNTIPGVLGFVADTKFSVDRGFFGPNESFDVAITVATEGAAIYYTTDGSTPSPTNPEATLFDPQIPLHISGTTVLRATAHFPGFMPSNVDTQTYLFLDDVILQSPDGSAPNNWPRGPINGQIFNFGMDPDIVVTRTWGPQLIDALQQISTISIVTDLENLVDPATGLYVHAGGQGKAWERPASIELINPDGTKGFQIDAGIRPRGNFSASGSNPKHAFRLFFRNEYGDSRLRYPLFGDEGVDEFKKLDLRTAQNDSWAFQASPELTFIHDVFSRDNQREMGQPYTRSRYHHLYINGIYWGLYQSQERAEANYGESYFGGDDKDFDVIKSTGGPAYQTETTDGNFDAWRDLWNQLRAGVDDNAAYFKVQGLNPDGSRNLDFPVLLDPENLIDYMLDIFYTGDEDRGLSVPLGNNRPNNFFAIRDRTGDRGFQFFSQDAEQSLESFHNVAGINADRTGPFTGSNQNNFIFSNPQWMHQDLMDNAEYRLLFADRVHRYFFNDGLFTSDAAIERFQSRADEIDLAIIAESARWGDSKRSTPFDKDDWLSALSDLYTGFFPRRSQIVMQQLRNDRRATPQGLVLAPLYPDIIAPEYTINGARQHGGSVNFGTPISILVPDGGSGTIYYTTDGSDPRAIGGAVSATAINFATNPPDVINTTTRIGSRVLENGAWSALSEALYTVETSLRITELMYHPADPTEQEIAAGFLDSDDFEFIELINTDSTPINVTDFAFTDGVQFTFGDVELAAGQRVVIVSNAQAFENRYGDSVRVVGEYGGTIDQFRLSNGGEQVILVDGAGGLIHEFRYSDDWYPETDGQGNSLNIIDTEGGYGDPENWQPSLSDSGTPGTGDSLIGDLNRDGAVGLADLNLLQQNMGRTDGVTLQDGDLDENGTIDAADFRTLVSFYGQQIVVNPTPAAAPAFAVSLESSTPENSLLAKIDLAHTNLKEIRDSVIRLRKATVVDNVLLSDNVDAVLADLQKTANPQESKGIRLRSHRALKAILNIERDSLGNL